MTEQVSVERSMRVDGVNRLTTKINKMLLRADDLDLFILLANRRDIRNAHVGRLFRVLKDGQNFETPLVCNYYSESKRYALLDGNHRYEALKRYFDKYPQRKVEVYVIYYTDLTPDEEKAEYTKWNSGVKQSTNDFVKAYWDTIPIVKWFNDDKYGFPCRVAHVWRLGLHPAIEFKTLVGAYLTKNNPTFTGGYQGSAMKLVEESQLLNRDDFVVIKSFIKDYMQVFGKIDRKNMHYKQVVFYSLFRIWLDNHKRVPYQTLLKFFEAVRGHRLVVEFERLGGTRANCTAFHDLILRDLNGRRLFGDFI